SLAEQLRERGSRLILAAGDPLQAFERMRKVTGARAVYWNRCHEPALVERDRCIKQRLRSEGLIAQSFNGSLLIEPWAGGKADGDAYQVFTPFWKNLQKRWQPPGHSPEPR